MASALIIDDSSFMRGKIRDILQKEGFETREAADGIKGLQMATTGNPDMIFLDIIMPGMDGLKILKTLREQGVKIPIVVVTADIQESTRKQCLQFGATAVVNKPPRQDDLLAHIPSSFMRPGGAKK